PLLHADVEERTSGSGPTSTSAALPELPTNGTDLRLCTRPSVPLSLRSPLLPFPSPLRSAAGERVRVRGLRPTTHRRSHTGPPHPTLSSTQTWRRGLPDPVLRQLRQRCPSCRPTAPICVSARGLPFPSPSVPLSFRSPLPCGPPRGRGLGRVRVRRLRPSSDAATRKVSPADGGRGPE